MNLALLFLANTAVALLSVLELCMLLRAVLSFLPIRDDHPILSFAEMVTEPVVAPIRALFDRFGWFENAPLDVPYIVAFLLISFLGGILGASL